MTGVAALITALAALLISLATLLHLVRQRKNEIRPELIVLERTRRVEADGLGLYLVNIGNGAALDVDVSWTFRGEPGHRPVQSSVAAQRRLAVSSGYRDPRIHEVEVVARYRDLDGGEYTMTFTPGGQPGSRGVHVFTRPTDVRWWST